CPFVGFGHIEVHSQHDLLPRVAARSQCCRGRHRALAANLLVNGDFENVAPPLAGWNTVDSSGFLVSNGGVGGSWGAASQFPGGGQLVQNVSLAAGIYEFGGDLRADYFRLGPDIGFQNWDQAPISLGGVTLGDSISNFSGIAQSGSWFSTPWQTFSGQLVVGDSGGTFTFNLNLQQGGDTTALSQLYADNLYIQAVPEPATMAMMLSGMGMLGWAGWRRRTGPSR